MSWSELPADLITAIAGRLTELADLSRFRSVCPSWRSASAAHAARRRVPLLLVPTVDHRISFNHGVWSLTDDRLREIPLLSARDCRYMFASNHGWMLAVKSDLSLTLVHPSVGGSADLPVVPGWFAHGDIVNHLHDMAWDWSPHGVMVSMPYIGAFFCRPGDKSWRPIVGCSSTGVTSVNYCDGAFFLFDGKVTVLDAGTLAVAAVIEPPRALEAVPSWLREVSLVASPEELLLVWTPLSDWGSNGGRVRVFRTSRAAGDRSTSWSEVDGIGDRAVFVDHLRAFWVEANALNGLRGNSVYVTRSYEEGHDDYGINVRGRYTVAVLGIADDPGTGYHSSEKLVRVWWNNFWQWPSWSWPSPH
ncbi:hypothetical protein ACP70R_034240 [Stipagrostis hirtigluma subsp. patula]